MKFEKTDICITEEKEIHKQICMHIHDTFANKRADYGSCTEDLLIKYGPVSMLTLLETKLARLNNLLLGDKEPMNEPIRDTLIDLANYAIIFELEMEKQRRYQEIRSMEKCDAKG